MSNIEDPGSCILSDPDITGIGVRSAIYAQNLLSFIPAIRILTDGKITYEEISIIEQQSSTILVTAFAILITAIIQARTLGLTNFHATIILNLSWMNNTNLSIYLLLYAYHRRELFRKRKETRSLKSVLVNEIKQIATNRVLWIGSVHLTLMSAFGIWLWSNPASFGGSKQCTLSAKVLLFGHGVSLSSKALRVWSIFIYAILLVPFLNMLLPTLVFITPFHWFLHLRCLKALRDQKSAQKLDQPKSSTILSGLWDGSILKSFTRKFSTDIGPIILGFLILAFVNIIFLVDTELALGKNTSLLQGGDGDWTFGQTLSLLLLLVPALDFYDILSEQTEKRQKKMKKLVEAAEKGKEEDVNHVIQLLDDEPDEHTKDKALMLAAANGNLSIVELLFQPHTKSKTGGEMAFLLASYRKKGEVLNWLSEQVIDEEKADKIFPQAIQSAVKHSSWDLVRVLAELESGIRVDDQEFRDTFLCAAGNGLIDCVNVLITMAKAIDTMDDDFVKDLVASGLHAAAGKGQLETVELLFKVDNQADINTRDEQENTALLCAAKGEYWEVFMWLCEHGSNVNATNKDQETALHFAAKGEDRGIVKWLCEELGADVDLETSQGKTALVIAAEHGRLNIVRALLSYKVNPTGPDSINALIVAAQNGHLKVVWTLFLEHKIEVNGQGLNGVTALMMAARNGHSHIVWALLEHNAEVNGQDLNGVTALMMAAHNGHVEIVDVLLFWEAKLNVKALDGRTALMIAAQEDHLAVVQTLLSAYETAEVDGKELDYKAALIGAAENGCTGAILTLLQHKAEVDGKDPTGVTALMMAAQNGHSTAVRILLISHANANAQGPDDLTALMMAAESRNQDIVFVLLSFGAEVNALRRDGITALMIAAENGCLDIVKTLLAQGADVNIKATTNALMLAAKHGHLDVVEALLAHHADINAQSSNGVTALMMAAAEGHLEVLKVLLANEARVNVQGPNGSDVTALMMASKNGHLEMVEILLEHKADVNAKTPDGATSLIMAAQKGHSGVVRALLNHRAEVNSQNSKGITALMMAAQNGHLEVVETLLEHKARVNALGPEGATALMLAAQNGLLAIVKRLRPEVDPQDLDGGAALQAAVNSARINEHTDIVQFLDAYETGSDGGFSPDPGGKISNAACTPNELNQKPSGKALVYPKQGSIRYGNGLGYARYNRPSQLRINSGPSIPTTGAGDEKK